MNLRRFAAFVAACVLLPASAGSAAQAPAPVVATSLAGGYTGSAACATCHAKAFDAWKGSQHARAMQPASADTVLGDFRNAKYTYAGVTSTFFTRDHRFFVRTDGPDGKLADFEILYTFGVAPLQQYLIEQPGGRLQALSIAWDARPKAAGGQRWFHLYPKQDIRAGDPLHWTGIGQNWNFMCAECHATNLRKAFDAGRGEFRTTWAEMGVGCEACHGPGAAHVAWAQAKRDGKPYAGTGNGLVTALDERRNVTWTPVPATGNATRSAARTTAREIETCARCHARAARISDDEVHGKPLADTHRVALLEDGLYWDDGQMRDEVYNWGSFVQSRMHAMGVTCSDCHDPHTQALRAPGNAVCAQCHASAKYDAVAHTHHPAGSPGAACAACHMPTTTYMVVDPRHDHSLRVPRPDLAAKVGAPNACSGCHAGKPAAWVESAYAKWWGTPARPPTQGFAEALRAGTTGAPGGRDALRALVDDKAQPPLVRASALERLGRWLTPTALRTVVNALNDPDPVVRLAAVSALGNTDAATRARYLPRMLADPVRTVRVEAARALAGEPEARLAPADREAFAKALDEYVATQVYLADRPEGQLNLGNVRAARGDAAGAQKAFEAALAIDPTSVEARVNLADLQRATGNEAQAQATLRAGIARNPKAAPLHYALGLALVRQKDIPGALRELALATKLAPDDARYAYVYAVALHDSGKPQDALKVLRAALAKQPYDREILAALAQFSAAGDRAAAQGYAKTLVALEPENPGYARLAASLR
ncbi:MAG: tetratricopeptide repeat protein [Burkholderiales bacterium]